MLYKHYADKIKKFAAIRDVILKFKFVIIGVLVANFVLTVSFLATQGMLLGGIKGDTEYTYGNDVEFSATALFAFRPSMEYSTDGGETWGEEAPIMPGEYKVRAVTHRMFVIPQRSKPVDFVINKKDLVLTLMDTEVEWRDVPAVNISGLVRGDSLNAVDVDVNSKVIGEASADIMENTVCILSTDGVDVTSAYNITAVDGIVNIIERLITLKANDVTKTYDGSPVSANGYSFVDSEVFDGHTLDVSFTPLTLASAGHESIKISDVKIYEENDDVTLFYRVVTQDGDANITKRPVSVVADDCQKVYDGQELDINNIVTAITVTDVDGDSVLPAGDVLNIKYSAAMLESDLTDPQAIIDYVEQVGVTNANNDVSSNYEIHFENGNVQISKRPITVTPLGETKTYDGKSFSNYSYAPVAEGGLVDGDAVAVILNTPNLSEVGSEDISISSVTVKGARGDVTHCYEITKGSAKAEITPRPIKITMKYFEKTYDGNAIVLEPSTHYDIDGLIPTHGVTVDLKDPTEYIDVCKNKPYEVEYYFTVNGVKNTEISKNYTVTLDTVEGIAITSKVIKITANDITGVTYSAAKLKIDSFIGNMITYEEFLGKDYSLTIDFAEGIVYKNAGTHKYSLDCHVWLNDDDVSENFEIDIKYTGSDFSKIVIDPYDVIITLDDVEKDYDGNSVEESDGIIGVTGLLGDDKVVVSLKNNTAYVNVRRDASGNVIAYNNIPVEYRFELEKDSFEYNYKIVYADDKSDVNITIKPCNVTIELTDKEQTYGDGTITQDMCVTVNNSKVNKISGYYIYNLIGDDKLIIEDLNINYVNVLRDVSGNVIPYNFTVEHGFTGAPNKDTDEIANNYNVIYVDDKHDVNVKINPYAVTVNLNNKEKTYNGQVVAQADCVTVNGYKDKDNYKLVGSDKLIIYGFEEHKNVKFEDGTVKAYEFAVYHGFTTGSNEDNYDVTYISRSGGQTIKIKINPCDVTIDLIDVEKTYDGQSVTQAECVKVNGSEFGGSEYTLVDGYKLQINGFEEHKNVNRDIYDNVKAYNFTVGYAFPEDAIPSNYNIIYVGDKHDVNITIQPYDVKIVLEDIKKTYNGNAVKETECVTVNGQKETYKLVGNDKLLIKDFEEYKNVNRDTNNSVIAYNLTLTHGFTLSSGSIAGNYNVIYVDDKHDVNIMIKPYDVTITLTDVEKTYNGNVVKETECVTVNGQKETYTLVGNDKLLIEDFEEYKNVNRDANNSVIAYNLTLTHGFTLYSGSIAGNYNVIYENDRHDVNIMIKPYDVTVTLTDVEKIYNGNAVKESECVTVNGQKGTYKLVGGDMLIIEDFKTDCINVKRDVSGNVTTYNFTVTHGFTLSSGSISGNYNVIYANDRRDVNITVQPYDVTITLTNVEKIYDGNDVERSKYVTVDRALIGNDKLIIVDTLKPKCINVNRDVSGNVIAYKFEVSHEFDLSSGSISGNYNVIYADGKHDVDIMIKPYDVTIDLDDTTKIYDGKAVAQAECVTVNGQKGTYKLVGVDKLIIKDFKTDCIHVKRDGSGNVIAYNFTVTHGFTLSSGSISGNYNVIYKDGKHDVNIMIQPYDVTITLTDVEKIYNGSAVKETECVTVNSQKEIYNLIGNDKLIIKDFKTDCVNVKRNGKGDVIAYNFTVTHGFTLSSGSIAGNYNVVYENDRRDVNIVIQPYEVKITLTDVEKIYDGKAVAQADCVSVNRSLVGNDKLIIKDFKSDCVNVKRDDKGNVTAYNFTVTHGFTLSGGSIEGNYAVIYEGEKTNVEITINPVVVTITTNDYTKMYDGAEVKFESIIGALTVSLQGNTHTYKNVSGCKLVGTDTFTMGFGGDAKYVDVLRYEGQAGYRSYQYTVAWSIGSSNVSNYDVVVQYTDYKSQSSSITIVPISVQIYTYDYQKMYDGAYVSVNDSAIAKIFVSKEYSGGQYKSYSEIFADNMLAYSLDAAGNDKISIFFGNGEEYKNVLRDTDGNAIRHMYTIDYEIEELKDTTVIDRIINNYDVTVIYTSSSIEYDEYDNEYTKDFSTIMIDPVVVSIDANDHNKIYDDKAVTVTTEGLLSDMTVNALKVDGKYVTVQRKRAVVGGKIQDYYELVSYTEDGKTVVEKMILRFLDIDRDLVLDEFVDVNRNKDGEAVVYRYNIIGEMLDGHLISNYDLVVNYDWFDYDKTTQTYTKYSSIDITPRTVYVTTESQKFVFDGEAHSYPQGKIDAGGTNGLGDGLLAHHSKKEAAGTWINYLEIVNVGTKLNTVGFTVIETASGTDKTANYEIVCVGGTLTVKPTDIALGARSIQGIVYNGKAHDVGVKSYKNVTLIEGDKILFARAATDQIDVGTGESYISLVVIKTRYGYEVYTFDGENYTINTYQRELSTRSMKIVVGSGQYIVISVADNVSFYTYDENTEEHFDTNAILCYDTAEESYSYYNFNNKKGTIQVVPRQITIICSSETAKVGPLTGTAWISEGDMIDGHYLYFETVGEATEKGVEVDNTIIVDDIKIYSSEEMTPETLLDPKVVNKNYMFTIISGKLLIE